jgi:hypothetical protein
MSTSSLSKKFKNSCASCMKNRETVFNPRHCFTIYHITFCIRSIPRLVIRYNEHIPGAYSFGKVHFVFSTSVRNALEQWHLFSSSVNLSMQKKYQQLAPAPWELLNK